MLKSGAALTISDADAVRVLPPLVPLMVSVDVPTGDVPDVVTVSVAVPDPVTDAGVIVAVAAAGSPETLNATEPAKPFRAATVTV